MQSKGGFCVFKENVKPHWIYPIHHMVPTVYPYIGTIDKAMRIFRNKPTNILIVDSISVVHPSLGVAEVFAGGVGGAVGVGAGLAADGAEGGVGVGLDGGGVGGGEGGDGADGVGVEDAAGAGGAVQVHDALDGLVDAGAVEPGVGDGVGGVEFEEDIGAVVDETGFEAVVEGLGTAVSFGVEGVTEDGAVGVGQGGHAALEVVGDGAGKAVDDVVGQAAGTVVGVGVGGGGGGVGEEAVAGAVGVGGCVGGESTRGDGDEGGAVADGVVEEGFG